MVCYFTPSLGLFSILYHHKAEQKPFTIWQKYGKNQSDKIVLYGLNETILWGDLDRWDYSNNSEGTPPHYSEYTGITLKWTFCIFFILTGTQLLMALLVKIFTSRMFSKRDNFLNKILHLLLSLNLSSPYEDWDQGRFTVKEYKERKRQTNIEMAWSLSVNILFSLVMMAPIWFTGIQQYRSIIYNVI